MKKTAIYSIAILGASVMSFGAYAQTTTPTVPGSETVIEQNNAQTRDGVAATPGMSAAETAQPASETMVPGSETQRETNRSNQRDAVSAGDDAMKTGSMTPDTSSTDTKVIVPGSGADVTSTMPANTQSDKALPDQPATTTK